MVRRARISRRLHHPTDPGVVAGDRRDRHRVRVPRCQRRHRPEDPSRRCLARGRHRAPDAPGARRLDQHRRCGDHRSDPRRRGLLTVAAARSVHALDPGRRHRSGAGPGHLLLSADAAVPAFGGQLGARPGLPHRAADRRPLLVAWRQLRLPPHAAGDCPPLGAVRRFRRDSVGRDMAQPLRPAVRPYERYRLGRRLYGRQRAAAAVHVPGGDGHRAGGWAARQRLAEAAVAADRRDGRLDRPIGAGSGVPRGRAGRFRHPERPDV